MEIDYTKITLCPALNYECYCQVSGRCEYCQYYFANANRGIIPNPDADCKGCGANFENKENVKAKFK